MKRFYLISAALAAGLCVQAQQHPTVQQTIDEGNGKVDIVFSDDGGNQDIYELFLENAPKEFNAAKVPRFAIRGKDNKFVMGIATMIKGVGVFDWGNPISSANDFTTSALTKAAPGNGSDLNASWNQSQIALNFIGLPGQDDQVGAYISGHFTGAGNAFKLHHAYVKYRGFEIGHTSSLFSDGAACTPTIDNEGPNGYTGVTVDGVQYVGKVAPRVKLGIALEWPSLYSCTFNAVTASVNQRVPDIPVYAQFATTDNSWIRFSALMRNLLYRDVVEQKNRDCVGWGIKASGVQYVVPNFLVYYQMAYGKGMTSYIQDLTGMGLDLTPKLDHPGRMDAVEAWGGYIGLQYNFSPKVFATATYSQVRDYAKKYDDNSTDAWPGRYKYAQYVAANCFYQVNSFFQTGVEYLWGRRVDMDGVSIHDNRINVLAQINF